MAPFDMGKMDRNKTAGFFGFLAHQIPWRMAWKTQNRYFLIKVEIIQGKACL